MTLLLGRSATSEALDPVALLPSLHRAFVAISTGEASVPARIAATAPQGLLAAMPGYVPGLGLAAKLVSIFPDPAHPGRSAHQGLVALFDHEDGHLLALMDGEVITAVRTAAAATVAMQALSRPDPTRIAVIGSGVQASAQLRLLTAITTSAEVVVGARSKDRAIAIAAHAGNSKRTEGSAGAVKVADSIEQAVRGSDVVFCCTDALSPVINRSWIAVGAHVSSVGGSHGLELDPATIAAGSIFVEWAGAQGTPPPAGAYELQGLSADEVTLIGAVLDGSHPGRTSPDQLTLYKSTGHAALDVAAAAVVFARAQESGLGVNVDL